MKTSHTFSTTTDLKLKDIQLVIGNAERFGHLLGERKDFCEIFVGNPDHPI